MSSIRRSLPRIKRYFRRNPGAPFVVGFQVLLLVCAGLLVLGNSSLANEVAVYAYYLLVAGVVFAADFLYEAWEGGGAERRCGVGLAIMAMSMAVRKPHRRPSKVFRSFLRPSMSDLSSSSSLY